MSGSVAWEGVCGGSGDGCIAWVGDGLCGSAVGERTEKTGSVSPRPACSTRSSNLRNLLVDLLLPIVRMHTTKTMGNPETPPSLLIPSDRYVYMKLYVPKI